MNELAYIKRTTEVSAIDGNSETFASSRIGELR